MYESLTVLIAESPDKKSLFTTEERKNFIKSALSDLPNLFVDSFNGLTVEYMRQSKSQVIVRGLRAVVDFEYEMTMASMNKKLALEVETVLMMASTETYFISSRGVKEVAKHGGDLSGLVPQSVAIALKNKFKP